MLNFFEINLFYEKANIKIIYLKWKKYINRYISISKNNRYLF